MRKILLEGRTIKTAQDAINLLDSGKLAGRLGGKRFIPTWLTEQPEMFKSLVELTLDAIDDDPNVAGDEVIQFMILASSAGPERWQSIVVDVPDVLTELSKSMYSPSLHWSGKLKVNYRFTVLVTGILLLGISSKVFTPLTLKLSVLMYFVLGIELPEDQSVKVFHSSFLRARSTSANSFLLSFS